MRMHLMSLLEVADEKYDEDDPALQENDDNENPFPGGVDAVDRTDGHVKIVEPDFDLQLRQSSRSGMVWGEIRRHALLRGRMKHPNVNSSHGPGDVLHGLSGIKADLIY
jgi:hypothetical protein